MASLGDANVRVRLDTRAAKSDLRDLTKNAAATAGRVGGQLRSTVGRGLNAVGIGAGVGAGLATVRSATSSGVGDVLNEALGGIASQISTFFLGDLSDKAKAGQQARNEAVTGFKWAAIRDGRVPEGAHRVFENRKNYLEHGFRGERIIREGLPRAVDVGDIIDRILKGIRELFDRLIAALKEFLGF